MKPENVFIASVHRLIKGQVYFEKMNNPYRSGTADVWYSGSKGDLWIEYKWIPALPQRAAILPDLSPQQRRWMNNRYEEGRNVRVIVGCPPGGVVLADQAWDIACPAESFRFILSSRRQIADWILDQVGESTCLQLPCVSSTRQGSSRRRTASS